MGKKRITTEEGAENTEGAVVAEKVVRVPKKKLMSGTLHIEATFNNTKAIFSDKSGNTLFWTSS